MLLKFLLDGQMEMHHIHLWYRYNNNIQSPLWLLNYGGRWLNKELIFLFKSRCPMNTVRGKKQNKRFLSTLNVYTNEKSHSVLGYVSPCEFEAAYYAN
jgi:hypothetical protein